MEVEKSTISYEEKEKIKEKLNEAKMAWETIAKTTIVDLDSTINSSAEDEPDEVAMASLPPGLRTANQTNGIHGDLAKYRTFSGYDYFNCKFILFETKTNFSSRTQSLIIVM